MGDRNSSNTSEIQSVDSLVCDSSNDNIDHAVLQEAGESSNSAEWSVTTSQLNSLDTSSSNSCLNCWANPSDTLKSKQDFMVLESTSTGVNNISNLNNSKYLSTRKTTAFKKKKPYAKNVSHVFENIFDSDNQMEITQKSICFNRFQKRKKLLPTNDEDFMTITNLDSSGMNSEETSMDSPKLHFSNKNRDQSDFDVPDYNLSSSSAIISDEANVSKTKENSVFKRPFDSFLSINENSDSSIMDESKIKSLRQKFDRKTIKVIDSVFDNIINDSDIISNSSLNSKNTPLNATSASSTVLLPILNNTYDIPEAINSNETELSSSKVKNNCELNKTPIISQPANETYISDNNIMSYNVPSGSKNAKNLLSDTYIVENNLNVNAASPKSGSTTISSIGNMSNNLNQSNSSVKKKPNFLRKLQLDEVPRDYNITMFDSDNSTVDDNINKTRNNRSKRFKLKKTFHDANSNIFDNVITSSQESEMSTSESTRISNTLNISKSTLNNGNLLNSLSGPKSKQSIENSSDASISLQSNILFNEAENEKHIRDIPLLLKFNTPNNFFKPSLKFNFKKPYGRLSLSFQEKSKNMEVNAHSISLNIDHKITSEENFDNFHKSINNGNDNLGLNFQTSNSKKYNTNSQVIQNNNQNINVSLPNMSNYEVEKNSESLQNTTYKLSQSIEPHFIGKHNLDAHSGVFNDLIDNDVNNDTSLNISQPMKFKNHKNVTEAHSVIFENIITNSEESNLTLNQNKRLSNSPLNNRSKIEDEISMFANTDELLLSKSINLRSSDNFKTLDSSKTFILEKSNILENKLNVLNSTHNNSILKSSKTEFVKKRKSEILNISNDNQSNRIQLTKLTDSVTDSNTCCEQNNYLKLKKSINSNSLPNVSTGLLETNNSKRIRLSTSTTKKDDINNLSDGSTDSSKHSTTNTANHEGNMINGSRNSNVSTQSHLKRSYSMRHSQSSISNNESLMKLMNTTIGSNSDECLSNQSERSYSLICSTSSSLSNENSISLNSISESLEHGESSIDQSRTSVLPSLSENSTSNDEGLTLMNTTIGSSENNGSPQNKSKHFSISINSLILDSDENNDGKISNSSLKQKSHSFNQTEPEMQKKNNTFPETEELSLIHTSTGSTSQQLLSKNPSKRSNTLDNSKNMTNASNSLIIPEGNTNNNSKILTRSSKSKNQSFDNIEPEIQNISKTPETEKVSLMSTTTVNVNKNGESSINKSSSKYNSKNVTNATNNSMNLEDNSNSISKISTHSSKSKKHSFDNFEPEIQNVSKTSETKKVSLLSTTTENMNQNLTLSKTKSNSKNNSKIVTNVSNNSMMLEENTNNNSKISTRLSKSMTHSFVNIEPEIQNISKTPETEKVSLMSTTTVNVNKNGESSINKSSSKYNSKNVTNATNNSMNLEDNSNSISKISTRSSKSKKHSFDNLEPEIQNVSKTSETKKISLLSTTTENMNQNLTLSKTKSTSKNNSKIVTNVSNNSMMLEENANNNSKISTRLSKSMTHSFVNIEPEIQNISKTPETEKVSLMSTTTENMNQNLTLSKTKSTSKNNSKIVTNVSNNSMMLDENTNNNSKISTRSSKSKNKSFDNFEQEIQNVSKTSETEKVSLMSTTTVNVNKNGESSINKSSSKYNSKIVTNVSNNSMMLEENTNNNSKISTRLSKSMTHSYVNIEPEIQNISKTSETEKGSFLFTTTGYLGQNNVAPSVNKLSSKYNSKNVTNASNNSIEENSNSKISTRSSKSKNHSFDNIEPEIQNVSNTLSETEKVSLLSSTSENMNQKGESSINKSSSKYNSKNVTNASNNSIKLEENSNSNSKISTRSSKSKKHSFDNFEPEVQNVSNTLSETEKVSLLSSTTGYTSQNVASSINKSSSKYNSINKSSNSILMDHTNNIIRKSTRLSKQKNNTLINTSTHSSRNSKSIASSSNNDDQNEESMFWTTLSENSMSISNIDSVNSNEHFKTPNTFNKNKFTIAENIINTIGIMSVNKHKATHPGNFELEDYTRLTRSHAKQSLNCSPSILTRVLAAKSISISEYVDETIMDQSGKEVAVNEKFKCLYNKESWVTKRLYSFLIEKLQPKYNIYSVKYAEKFVKYLASILKQIYNDKVDLQLYTDMLRYHMARYAIIKDTFDYVDFLTDFIPRPYYDRLTPGLNLETSAVKFDPLKYYIPILEDEEFLRSVLECLKAD